jgi:hypothetical protein
LDKPTDIAAKKGLGKPALGEKKKGGKNCGSVSAKTRIFVG